ncbi:MAG: hypothetical protein LBD10_11090 [Desulfobulbus sp.]|jgi:hypothetical protein|uniref:hypothetical protein n=1 Tax=Desulfobulbus sp. TaxID=895 RepID=UPI00284CA143|nr:hypothetical protein [Desulfobulbus sp.]MDR2550732.1 hypothetical protein [Desulfobulbus sp.]
MDTYTPLQNAVAQYRLIRDLMLRIEQAMQEGSRAAEYAAFTEELARLQDAARANDGATLDLLRRNPSSGSRELAAAELTALLGEVYELNQRLRTQMRGHMALLRDELRKLQTGATMLQGYKPETVQTGKRFSSSG